MLMEGIGRDVVGKIISRRFRRCNTIEGDLLWLFLYYSMQYNIKNSNSLTPRSSPTKKKTKKNLNKTKEKNYNSSHHIYTKKIKNVNSYVK